MEEYMAAVAERYPLIDQIDVLNENMYLNTWNGEEHAAGTPQLPNGIPSHDTINRVFSLINPGKFEQLVLGQVKTSKKSNEITAIPELLNLLNIEGCIITIDAMGTQKKIAETIIEKKDMAEQRQENAR